MKNWIFQCIVAVGLGETAWAVDTPNLVMLQKKPISKMNGSAASTKAYDPILHDFAVAAMMKLEQEPTYNELFGTEHAGGVNFNMFLDVVGKVNLEGSQLKSVFDVLDVDDDGYVTENEFVKAIEPYRYLQRRGIANHTYDGKSVSLDQSVGAKETATTPTPPTKSYQDLLSDLCTCGRGRSTWSDECHNEDCKRQVSVDECDHVYSEIVKYDPWWTDSNTFGEICGHKCPTKDQNREAWCECAQKHDCCDLKGYEVQGKFDPLCMSVYNKVLWCADVEDLDGHTVMENVRDFCSGQGFCS